MSAAVEGIVAEFADHSLALVRERLLCGRSVNMDEVGVSDGEVCVQSHLAVHEIGVNVGILFLHCIVDG